MKETTKTINLLMAENRYTEVEPVVEPVEILRATVTEINRGVGQCEYILNMVQDEISRDEAYALGLSAKQEGEYVPFYGIDDYVSLNQKQLKELFPDYSDNKVIKIAVTRTGKDYRTLDYSASIFNGLLENLKECETNADERNLLREKQSHFLNSPKLERYVVNGVNTAIPDGHFGFETKNPNAMIVINGNEVSARTLKYLSEQTDYNFASGINAAMLNHMPTNDGRLWAMKYVCEKNSWRGFEQYDSDELGLARAEFHDYSFNDISNSYESLKEAFMTAKGRSPMKMRPFVIAKDAANLTDEEIVSKFDAKRIGRNPEIPLYTRVLLMTKLNKNDYDRAMQNPNVFFMEALCVEGYEENRNMVEFLLNHPNARPDFVYDVMKTPAVRREITPSDSIEKVRSLIAKHAGDNEIEKIQSDYHDFHFDECVFDIKFSDVEMDGLHAGILKPGDTRMAILGQATNCCQHLDGIGESAMMYGLMYEHAGFWIIESKSSGKILAQAEVWEKDKDTLVFDNIEFSDDRDTSKFAKIIGEWAKNSGYKNVYVGTGYTEIYSDQIKKISGFYPPINMTIENSEFYSEHGKDVYTDADDECIVVMENGKLQQYFENNHDERLSHKKTDVKDRQIIDDIKYANICKYFMKDEFIFEKSSDYTLSLDDSAVLCDKARAVYDSLSPEDTIRFCYYHSPAMYRNEIKKLYKPYVLEGIGKQELTKLVLLENLADELNPKNAYISRGALDSINEYLKNPVDTSKTVEQMVNEVKENIKPDTEMVPVMPEIHHDLRNLDTFAYRATLYQCENDINETMEYLADHSSKVFADTLANSSTANKKLYIDASVSDIYNIKLQEKKMQFDALKQIIDENPMFPDKQAALKEKAEVMLNCDENGNYDINKAMKVFVNDTMDKLEETTRLAIIRREFERNFGTSIIPGEYADYYTNIKLRGPFGSPKETEQRFSREVLKDTVHILNPNDFNDAMIGTHKEIRFEVLTDTFGTVKGSFDFQYGEPSAIVRDRLVETLYTLDPEQYARDTAKNYPDASEEEIKAFADSVDRKCDEILTKLDKNFEIRNEIDRRNITFESLDTDVQTLLTDTGCTEFDIQNGNLIIYGKENDVVLPAEDLTMEKLINRVIDQNSTAKDPRIEEVAEQMMYLYETITGTVLQ